MLLLMHAFQLCKYQQLKLWCGHKLLGNLQQCMALKLYHYLCECKILLIIIKKLFDVPGYLHTVTRMWHNELHGCYIQLHSKSSCVQLYRDDCVKH